MDKAWCTYCIGNQDVNYDDYNGYNNYFDEKIDLSDIEFTVYGTCLDEEAPVLDSISIDKTDINYNQLSTITVKATDNLSGIKTGVYDHNNLYNYNYYNYDYEYCGTSTLLFLSPLNEIVPYDLREGKDGYYVDFYVIEGYELGTWEAVGLILVDNAGNTTYYFDSDLSGWVYDRLMEYTHYAVYNNVNSYDFSSCTINVDNLKADITPPVLKNATIDKNTVNGKDQVTITLDITDDRYISNGYCVGYINYYNINNDEWKYSAVVKENGKFISRLTFNGWESDGLWEVDCIYLYDEAGNDITYYNSSVGYEYDDYTVLDLSHLSITATDMNEDYEDNIEITISNISISRNNMSVFDASPVEVIIELSDNRFKEEYNDYTYASISYISPSGTDYKQALFEYKDGKFIATLDFSSIDEVGTWRIDRIFFSSFMYYSIAVSNIANPYKYVYLNDTVMDLSAFDIELTSPDKDSSKPVLNSVSVDKPSIDLGETMLITVNAEDESGIGAVKVRYTTGGGAEAVYTLEKVNNSFQGYLSPLGWDSIIGKWKILSIEIIDNTGNVTIVGNHMNDKLYTTTVDELMDLSTADFEVTDNLHSDVNRDGQIDILDIGLAARSYNLDNSSQIWEPRADINKDNKIDIFDLVLICRWQ